ncbi:MAG: helix-turn-helix domain-containing protein [Desulfovibrio sp.]|nr:helix-turn-helix domain-containing protein [Desulfovibrio sp.]
MIFQVYGDISKYNSASLITTDFFTKEDKQMDDKPMPDFKEAMSRIQLVTGCGTQQELASLLGIKQSSISDAKKRGSIPSDWLLTLWRKKGVNPDWILWGQGAKWLQAAEILNAAIPPIIYLKEVHPPEECSIEELIIEIVRRVINTSHYASYEAGPSGIVSTSDRS